MSVHDQLPEIYFLGVLVLELLTRFISESGEHFSGAPRHDDRVTTMELSPGLLEQLAPDLSFLCGSGEARLS